MKLSRVVEVALNGDAHAVDPAVRRTLYSMADALDEAQRRAEDNLAHEIEKVNATIGTMSTNVASVRRLVIGTTTTVLGGVIVGIANILIQL